MYLKIWFENEKKRKPFSPIPPPARFRPAGPVGPAGHLPSPPLSHPLTDRARLSASSLPNRFSPPLSQFSNRSRPSRSTFPTPLPHASASCGDRPRLSRPTPPLISIPSPLLHSPRTENHRRRPPRAQSENWTVLAVFVALVSFPPSPQSSRPFSRCSCAP